MKKRLHSVIGALLSLSVASQAFALGTASYSSELISARSLGQGGVGVAGVDLDGSSSYLNPAAMTSQPGTQITIGGTYVNASPSFTNAGNSPANPGQGNGSVTGARATSVVVPDFGVTTQFMDGKLSAGLAVVAPFGLETHFDGDSPMRYAATDTRLHVIDITPSVAYKINDMFSVGAGADYYDTTEGQLDHKLNLSAFGAGTPDGNTDLTATGGGWGYHLGTTIKPNEKNEIGVVYHSNVKMNLTGNLLVTGIAGAPGAVIFGNGGANTFSAGVSAPVYIPQNVQLGWAFMPNEQWRFELDAAWYDWYAARQLGIVFNGLNATAASNLPTFENPTVFNPRKSINLAFGANYKANDQLQLRGGAYYEAASLPESQFDPAFVDLPRYGLTAGTSYAFTKALGVDFAYNAVFFHSRSINIQQIPGTAANAQPGFSGSFSSFANIVSANLNYKFDTHF
jgi:long-chain fatty acid transport protein